MAKQLFSEVSRRTVAQSIVDQVKDLIYQGRLRPGQKLPSERQLCDQLGVGRSAVREAMSAMLALNIIEIRPGDGAYIREDFPKSVLQSVDWSSLIFDQEIADLLEARISIELTTARLAALRATPEQRRQLHDLADGMAAAPDLESCIALDLQFHVVLADAAENMVLRGMIVGIQHLMHSSMLQVMQSDEMRRLAIEQHQALCAAIDREEPLEAEQAMRAHLKKDLDYFKSHSQQRLAR